MLLLGGGYFITKEDQWNYVLSRKYTSKRGVSKGEEKEVHLSYSTSLYDALLSYINKTTNLKGKVEAKELLCRLDKMREEIKTCLSSVKLVDN